MNTIKLKNTLFKIYLQIFVLDKRKRARLKVDFARKYLDKYVKKALSEYKKEDSIEESPKIIWQYWHQGVENAPDLIKASFRSVKKYVPDYEQRILSYDTIKDYVDIPQKYYDLLEKKKIPIAIFSDILRLYLLEKYGGIWMDSTIYLTDKLPEEVQQAEFFCFKIDETKSFTQTALKCYFIKTPSNNVFIKLLKSTIENYWQKNDYLINYFMFEHIMTMLRDKSSDVNNIVENIPELKNIDRNILCTKLYDIFNIEEFEKAINNNSIHKISYKVLKDVDTKNTYYEYLINKI